MKKILAIILSLAMLLVSLAAFAEEIEDTMTSPDGVYEVAMVTDVGQLKDGSFNEGTWNGVKTYAVENGLSYKYYQPANGNNATDEDRIQAMTDAVNGGAKVIVAPGFMQATAMTAVATANPDVKFVFIDGWPLTDEAGNVLNNVSGIAFKEEQCGYLAGYAIVKEGFTKIGFAGGGGGTNPACMRYGYGFLQGANAAAAELGITVDVKYTWAYGATFSPSAELQSMISGWYETGTEVVFSCGGSIFNSITAAADANDGYVIGVDVDQSTQSTTVVTSALKGITPGTIWALTKAFDGTWDEIGGNSVSLGADDDAVGLPVATWSLENYTVDEYEAMLASIKSGAIAIDDDTAAGDHAADAYSNLNVTVIE